VLETASGVFSPGHLDLGTTVLLREVPTPPPGSLLDLGCGWGPLAITAALLQTQLQVTAVDVNERALDLVRRNAARVSATAPLAGITALTPDAVPADARFDTLWSNPPIRIGKPALHALLGSWIPRVVPGGEAWLVVQKNLGADSLAAWIGDQDWGAVARIASSKGFRVLRVTRAGETSPTAS
jgi:16S rRNA G1207 methylase RsmC